MREGGREGGRERGGRVGGRESGREGGREGGRRNAIYMHFQWCIIKLPTIIHVIGYTCTISST